MARINAPITQSEREAPRMAVAVGAGIAALTFRQEIFVPIALAILLSIVWAPSVGKLHGLGLGRVFPALLVIYLAFSILVTLATVLASQLRDLAGDLPRYEETVTKKVASIKGAASGGALKGIEDIHRRARRILYDPVQAFDREAGSPIDATHLPVLPRRAERRLFAIRSPVHPAPRRRRHNPGWAWWLQAAQPPSGQPGPHGIQGLGEPFATTLLDAVHHCLADASVLTEGDLSRAEPRREAQARTS